MDAEYCVAQVVLSFLEARPMDRQKKRRYDLKFSGTMPGSGERAEKRNGAR